MSVTTPGFYRDQLSRFIDKWHVAATYKSKADDQTWPIRLHVGKYSQVEAIGDIDQRQRRGIISIIDIDENATPPKDGDKIYYLDETATIDGVDPRIEVGQIIGYDFILRGD